MEIILLVIGLLLFSGVIIGCSEIRSGLEAIAKVLESHVEEE